MFSFSLVDTSDNESDEIDKYDISEEIQEHISNSKIKNDGVIIARFGLFSTNKMESQDFQQNYGNLIYFQQNYGDIMIFSK